MNNLDSFYVTLPSNSSNKDYPNNTQSDYTTVLSNPIKLNGKYEVALTEMTYSPMFLADFGQLSYKNYELSYPAKTTRPVDFTYKPQIPNGYDLSKLVDDLNLNIRNYSYKAEFDHRYKLGWKTSIEMATEYFEFYKYTSKNEKPFLVVLNKYTTFEIVDLTDKSVYKNDFIEAGGKIISPFKFEFSYSGLEKLKNKFFCKVIAIPVQNEKLGSFLLRIKENSTKVNAAKDNLQIEIEELFNVNKNNIPNFKLISDNVLVLSSENKVIFKGLFANLLKQKDEYIFESGRQTFTLRKKLNIINYAAVYTDIIEEQYFGNSLSRILRCINMDFNDKDIAAFYDNPIYVAVNKTEINSINIRISDLTGQLIKFEDIYAFVILTLHFRKIK